MTVEAVEGWVYFVEAEGLDLIKIGFTTRSPDRRLRRLDQGSPAPIRPLGVIVGAWSTEARLHARFAHLRRRFEWFEGAPELADFIRDNAQPWPSGKVALPAPEPEPDPFAWAARLRPYLTAAEAAALLGCKPARVRGLALTGQLGYLPVSRRGDHRYPIEDLIDCGLRLGIEFRPEALPGVARG